MMAEKIAEECLNTWRERLKTSYSKNKDLTSGDICSLFRHHDLREAFFKIIDRDQNGCLSYEEWVGVFTKSIDPKHIQLVDWFIDQFCIRTETSGNLILTKSDFNDILSDNEFGYRFSLIVSKKSNKIKTIELMSVLEIMASLSTDGKWLSWLKFQFLNICMNKQKGQKNATDNLEMMITLDEFTANFEFKEDFLAHRLFNYLDETKTGYLSMIQFINGLELIVNGNELDKMLFLFKVFDVNGDGSIDYEEMKLLLKCCIEDTPYADIDQAMEELTDYLFTNSDKDNSGEISFEELQAAFKKYDSIFSQLSFSTSIWIKSKFVRPTKQKSVKNKITYRMKTYVDNNMPTLFFWSIYMLIHAICSGYALLTYIDKSVWVIIARFFGASLNFNCSLILVLVLRKHFTWVRIGGGNKVLPLDDFIEIHRRVGYIILVEGLIHTVAHFINLYYYCMEEGLNYLNALFTGDINIGYPTGVILLIMFMVIFICAMPFVRRSGHFQIFHWFHMLTIPWLLIMCLHGKKFWIWILIPLFCYILENILRYRSISSNKYGETFIEESYILPSKVTHLVIKRPPKFRFSAGDYIFINIPTIAKYEWHPFSISSAPECSDDIWLHIRAVGQWTERLLAYSKSSKFDVTMSSHNRSRQSNPGHVMRTTFLQQNTEEAVPVMTADCQSLRSDYKRAKMVSFETVLEESLESEMMKKSEIIVQKGILKKSCEKLDIKNDTKMSAHTLESVYTSALVPSDTTTETSQPSVVLPAPDQSSMNGMITNDLSAVMNQDDLSEAKEEETSQGDQSDSKASPADESTPVKHKGSMVTSSMMDEEVDPARGNVTFKLLRTSMNEIEGYDSFEQVKKNSFSKTHLLKDEHKNELSVIVDLEKENTENKVDGRFTQQAKRIMKAMTTSLLSNDILSKSTELLERNSPEKDKNQKQLQGSPLDQTDILGYQKMYQKDAKVRVDNIGLDNIWRLRVFIDGPYGTPSYSIFDSEHAVLVGAGIGITPFASILQSVMRQYKQKLAKCPNCNINLGKHLCSPDKLNVKKVDFIWVTREQRSLEWFITMLSKMEIEQRKYIKRMEKETGEPVKMFMESHLYVTSANRQSGLKSIGLHLTLDALYSKEDSCLVDGLLKRTHYGRPNWDIVMQSLVRQQQGKIDVFYCGPQQLADTLSVKCSEYGFTFSREIF